MEELKILMVEDVASDAELALRELRQLGLAINARRVENEQDFRRALAEFQPHVILSDFSMPAFDGLTALDLAREHLPDVPFVFVSGTIGEDRAVEAMRRGATDYVLKDRMARLVPVIQRALQEADARAARRRAEVWRDGQNRILEMIATGVSLGDTLEQLMLTVESQGAGMLCSILLLDADGLHLRTGAAPTLPEAYNRAVDGVAIGPAVGSCGTAAYRKEQVVVTDITTDPLWADYRGLAAAHGLRACWSTPVISRDGSLLGTFANYFRVPRGPSAAELDLVESAANIARIAIEKRRDEGEILRAKERLDLALEASGVALWDNDVSSGRVYLSEHWARLLNDAPRETVTTVEELVQLAHPDDRQMLLDLARDTIRGSRASYDAEHRVMTKSGQWKWILSRGKVVDRAPDGHALRVVGTNVDITESKLQQQRIDYLSYYDPLTGLPNRTLFVDRTGQQMRSRGGEPLMVALILINLERFRYINETLGRDGGDELLKQVALRLEGAFKGKDYLARIGADSFGVVMRGIRDAAAVVHVVENQILNCFQEPYGLNGRDVRVAAKAGIAMFPADGGDADTLFRNAEAALKKGRGSSERFLFYAADMNARAAHALSLETRLRKAVEEQQFVLHYQPKINLACDVVCGLEALIRWNDPETGLVPPAQFVPLLEETGMILEVGRWAIQHALSQRLAWHISGLQPPRIAVNVSAIQLRQADFVRVVRDSLDAAGVGPHGLDLEITESLIIRDIQDNIEKLRAVKEMGVEIAIDDFGTGYSSLSYVARLPLNALKIDRSFISGMADSPQDMAIVTTIIALARSLNLRVIAEGVEKAEQSRLLALMKCDEAQGFHFSKPLPAAGIEPLLRERTKKVRRPELEASTQPVPYAQSGAAPTGHPAKQASR